MAVRKKSNLSLDFSDVPFDNHRSYGVDDWVAGHVIDADSLTYFIHYAKNIPAPIFGEAFLIASILNEYDVDDMDTTYTVQLMDAEGSPAVYVFSRKDIRKIHIRRSVRLYGGSY
jgi:hypothetical protein